jgi:glyoxylase-like metal-dependent hydrolase (beta-lactamase superfamily II)
MQQSLPRSTRWRRRLIALLTILILGGVLVVVNRPPPTAKKAGPHVLSPRAVTIVPGIHLLGGLAPAAAYVVETSEGLVLIDAGLRAAGVKREMAALGLDWARVCAIFLTHLHHDHSGGAQELRAATGARVYVGQGDAAALRAGRPREALFGTFAIPTQPEESARKGQPALPLPVPTTVDVELRGGETVSIGEASFHALATPGHTAGSTCFLMERGDLRALFSGDVIISLLDSDSPSRMSGPLGTYAARAAPRYGGDAKAFLSTLRVLRDLPVPHLVLPGHPRRDAVPQSPVVSQPRWQALLDAGIRDMEQLQERFARDGANFLDGTPKQLLPDLYYLGEFKTVAVYGFASSSKFFLIDAPGGAGLSEFLAARLKRLGVQPAAPTAVLLTSGNPEETAGLAELIEKHQCAVVVGRGAWEAIKNSCPAGTTVLSPEDLPRKQWFAVKKTLPLRGCGVAPVAYLLPWAGKAVLFSGRIPIKPRPFHSDVVRAGLNRDDYRESLDALAQLEPDLWLPAFPVDCQNANLYDRDWEDVIAKNVEALQPPFHFSPLP